MPITQERILALVQEFEFSLSVHRGFLTNLERLAKSLDTHAPETSALIRAEIAALPFIPTDALRDERKHYNSTAMRNEKSRRIMERKRRAAGVPERGSIQYRVNAMERAKGLDDERAYREFMQGSTITEDQIRIAEAAIAKREVSDAALRLAESRVTQYERAGEELARRGDNDDIKPPEALTIDDTSPDPARWSPARLSREATKGTINLDDEL